MKHTIQFLTMFLFLIVGIQAKSQTKSEQFIIDKFSKYYNTSLSDSIFALFDENMQQAMPLNKTNEFVIGLLQGLGMIMSSGFTEHVNQVAVFKTSFEKGVFNINLAVDENDKICGLFIKPYIDNSISIIDHNNTALILPFYGEWFTFWGGETVEQNYHVAIEAQKGAFDFVIKDKEGKSYKNNGTKNEDYYCFGQELIAPCDAVVVFTVDGVKDNIPQEMNPSFPTGNTVVLKTTNDEYIFLCHFKQFSINVKQGQQVKQGEKLGLCGNSGNSSEAHLHFHIQNTEHLHNGMGAKCYFEKIWVNNILKNNHMPIRNEFVNNHD